MASIATGKSSAETEAEVKRLQAELDSLKKDFEARISAMEALLPKAEAPAAEEISAETLALIAVAVTNYLGKKVKIRSAKYIPTTNQWTQTGRTVIQASHNLNR